MEVVWFAQVSTFRRQRLSLMPSNSVHSFARGCVNLPSFLAQRERDGQPGPRDDRDCSEVCLPLEVFSLPIVTALHPIWMPVSCASLAFAASTVSTSITLAGRAQVFEKRAHHCHRWATGGLLSESLDFADKPIFPTRQYGSLVGFLHEPHGHGKHRVLDVEFFELEPGGV